jgi:hypothetical protein
MAPDYAFFLLSAHSTGYTPLALTNLLGDLVPPNSATIVASEMVVHDSAGRALPSGATSMLTSTV